MFYELVTLSSHILKLPEVIANAEVYLNHPKTAGCWLGAWTSENGRLGSVRILRRFVDAGELSQERTRALHHANPFGAADGTCTIEMESYAGFPSPRRAGFVRQVLRVSYLLAKTRRTGAYY
ncbi:hypothetical protein [Paraburkholderia aspalathi]|uniref:hypothetical protein n=1 Tax=Paraburkholderia aspalathi TaxID=1324617 RepID=UPI0038BC3CC2